MTFLWKAPNKFRYNSEMYPEGLKAIIFDMDGVLVESEPLHLLSVQSLLSRYGVDYTEEENREFLGRKDLLIADALIKRHSLDLTVEGFIEAKEELLAELISTKGEARPGVYEVLEAAKSLGIPMAVASSATTLTIKLVVKTLAIEHYFSWLCSGDEVTNGKPAPDIYLLAANRLGVDPTKCLVVEDTITGLTAAKAAGMFSISIPCAATAYQDHSIADLKLSSLEQLSVEQIFGYNAQTKDTDRRDGKSFDCRR